MRFFLDNFAPLRESLFRKGLASRSAKAQRKSERATLEKPRGPSPNENPAVFWEQLTPIQVLATYFGTPSERAEAIGARPENRVPWRPKPKSRYLRNPEILPPFAGRRLHRIETQGGTRQAGLPWASKLHAVGVRTASFPEQPTHIQPLAPGFGTLSEGPPQLPSRDRPKARTPLTASKARRSTAR